MQAQEAWLSFRVHEDEETSALGTYPGEAAVEPRELPLWRPVDGVKEAVAWA